MKLKRPKLIFLLLCLFTAQAAVAQIQITGRVIDDQSEPVIGAQIVVKGTQRGATTDANGQFQLAIPNNQAVLVVSFIGYETQEVTPGNSTHVNIALRAMAQRLDDVVVVGFGTQKKANLTGAVSTISGEEMTRRPVPNTASMLQAQVPGLRVTQGRGQPGNENVQFRIRGQGTFSGTGLNPLILVNGVEADIATLDPNIIESVTVLKDAASAAIYGSRAANGVILVTTKTGGGINAKDNVMVSYNGNFAIHQAIALPDMIWDSPTYMKYYNLAKTNSALPGKPAASTIYTDEALAAYSDPNRDPIQYPSFNWVDYMFGNAFVQSHNLSTSGTASGGKSAYNVSLSYLDQPGVMRGQTYQRFNGTIDITSRISSFIRTGAYISGSRGERQETAQGDQDAYLATLSQAPTYMPWLPDDGSGITRWTHKAYEHEGTNKNMAAIIATGTFRKDFNTDVNGQYWVEVTPVKGLVWYTKAATRMRFNRWKRLYAIPVEQYYYQSGNYSRLLDTRGPGLTSNMTSRIYANYYSTLKYDFATPSEAHKFSIMGGFSQETENYDWLEGYRQYFDFDLDELNAGSTAVQTATGNRERWALQSWFGRFNYSYKDRYLFEANARYDGTSRIAKENRWGLFPSFSAGWRLSEERWIKDLDARWINNVKFRGSWGKLGNQNIDLFSYNAVVVADVSYPFNNTSESSGVAQKAFSNRNLKWETTTVTNVGVDLVLFNGLNITFDWYDKTTSDILRRAQANYMLGLTAPYVNVGEVSNKGMELSVQYSNMVRNGLFQGMTYSGGFFVERVRNKLTKFGADEISTGRILREGIPYYSFYCYEAIGIFKDINDVINSPVQFGDTEHKTTFPGDIKYADVNGPEGKPDGKVDEYDRAVVPGRFPRFEYSLNFSVSWKGFDLSLLAQGVNGIKHYARDWGLVPYNQGSPPTWDYIRNMWTEENPNGKYPRMYYGNMGGTKNTRESTYWLYDGSYFRLKNITFGYTLPGHWTKNVLQRVRIYFSGDNLFTSSKFPQGGDPDRTNDSSSSTRLLNYPQNKIYSFGVNLDF